MTTSAVSDEKTEAKTVSKLYRRPPGIAWLLALLLIPLFLGAIGYRILDKSDADSTVPSVDASATLTTPSVTAAPVPPPAGPALAVSRTGNDITVTGEVPDETARAGLLESVKTAAGPDANVIDQTTLRPGAPAPDFVALGTVLTAGAGIPDLNVKVENGTVVLSGTAGDDAAKAVLEEAAKVAWPNLAVDNQILIPGAPGVPAAPAAGCVTVQADITALLTTPITFETGGATLAGASTQTLTAVADKIKGCPASRIAVTGYTDNTGNDDINIPLSASRAKSVAEYLVSQGISPEAVTSEGRGAANPIAPNDTPEGQSANRRVEITVS